MTKHIAPTLLLTVATVFPLSMALAQTAPDAGRILQENNSTLDLPRASSSPLVEMPLPDLLPPGGEQITLETVKFSGNTLYSESQLLVVLGAVQNKSFDLAGLKALATKITDYYHNNGYPFARAYLPQQEVSSGTLQIEILEGRYGTVNATGTSDDTESAKVFLTPLQSGDVIESSALERATLILSDQPGVKAAPIIRPGQELGTGDLNVPVELKPELKGDIGGDNFGNRYSGEYRARLDLTYDSPFLFGDQIQLKSMGTDEATWLGSLMYSLPLGASGVRAQMGYMQTDYSLGKQFSHLDATGFAKVYSAGLSYPLIRSQPSNLTVATVYQHKDLQDEKGLTTTLDNKNSDSAPVSAQFDMRDGLGGGGITYGTVGWTHGEINLDGGLREVDLVTAKTDGAFDKFNLDVARLQKLPDNFTFFARYSGQWATGNLDSSEGFGLGGSNGVRAYPVSEAYGDGGWLAQAELRYSLDPFSPFVFYDAGRVKVNVNTWDASKNTRSVAGPGFGVRFYQDGWHFETSVAWRTQGGEPESDTMDKIPRVWASLDYSF